MTILHRERNSPLAALLLLVMALMFGAFASLMAMDLARLPLPWGIRRTSEGFEWGSERNPNVPASPKSPRAGEIVGLVGSLLAAAGSGLLLGRRRRIMLDEVRGELLLENQACWGYRTLVKVSVSDVKSIIVRLVDSDEGIGSLRRSAAILCMGGQEVPLLDEGQGAAVLRTANHVARVIDKPFHRR